MKSFQGLQEERGEKAFKQAIAMGLQYGGFGYWKDPQTGDTKFKTENDTLVPVEPDVSAEKFQGGPGGAEMAQGGGMQGAPMGGGMMGAGGMLAMPGMGQQQPGAGVLGAPEPGEEQEEGRTREGWEAGPDGDTCVGPEAQDPAKVQKDSFVGTTNYAKWVAGMDGDNMNTVSIERLQETPEPIEPHHSFNTLLREMGDPKAEAEAQGLEFAGYGWYRDPKTGKRVAKIEGDQLVRYDSDQGGNTLATTHTGNPTGPQSGLTPADRARSMGLQSDGSGGYVDPSTGQVVARTVNSELVFYDAQGGAISDGSGGEQLTQSSPSWVDPVSGLIVVPPAQPETPEEQAAVPDSIPAQAPMGLDAFFNKRKIDMYKQRDAMDAAEGDINSQQAEIDSLFDTHPMMGRLLNDMKEVIERANESGDENKMAAATILQDALEELGQLAGPMYDRVKEEDHEELGQNLKRRAVADAKAKHYEDSQPEGSRRASDNPVPLEYFQSGGNSREYTDIINQILDRNTELEKAPKSQKVPREVVSDGIKYKIEPKKMEFASDTAKLANDALREAGVNYRVDNNPKITQIDWDVEGAEEEMDAEGNRRKLGAKESKRKALSALRTWRNEVLPRFSPGTIVNANAMQEEDEGQYENQRERIYQLAGFGENFGQSQGITTPGMYAIVVENEDGENELLPISPTKDQKNKRSAQMESVYVRMNDHVLNMVATDVIVEMLLS